MQVKLQTDLAFVSRRPRFVGGRVAGAQRRPRRLCRASDCATYRPEKFRKGPALAASLAVDRRIDHDTTKTWHPRHTNTASGHQPVVCALID
jgi:hypothetical protein